MRSKGHTNLSSNKNRKDDSEVDINDIDLDVGGIIGDDGGFELKH